ncbi:hypothetical protein LROSL1_0298 [Furfurilactobacillus rossiae]|uniref:hypothetical protein n=1 Tax=Furfurilactobacillus rossiae TaxID=231049 RepID=UPI0015BDB914|nr:hypothetical protein [Furfurilactobacillus rossiae]MCF6165758.1 hypothetical protein [Furfurilactobacillus rossiae]QLE63118.1 hypothetical protein LROSL1_0298 [Furfurilactobacillus rossiae]
MKGEEYDHESDNESESNAQLEVNFSEKSFKVEGRETFVNKMFQVLKAELEQYTVPSTISKNETDKQGDNQPSEDGFRTSNNKFIEAGIYTYDDTNDKFEIITSMPGSSNSQKMINIALLLCLFYDRPVSRDEIKEQAEVQNAYDPNNISAHFSKDRQQFIKTKATSKGWTVSLTVPGHKDAVDFLNELFESLTN